MINKKVYHDYEIIETVDAWIVLKWYEVKSVKQWKINFTDWYVLFKNNEAWLEGVNIPLYEKTSPLVVNYNPKRSRKLLLKRYQISRLAERTHKTWLILKPLEVYVKNWFIKIKLWLCKLKRKVDKKEEIKKKDLQRQLEREFKEYL